MIKRMNFRILTKSGNSPWLSFLRFSLQQSQFRFQNENFEIFRNSGDSMIVQVVTQKLISKFRFPRTQQTF